MEISIKSLGIICVFLISLLAEDSITINAYTSEFPPYNYTNDAGELTGVSFEVVNAAAEEAGIIIKTQSCPWARSYEFALTEPNVMIFSITRTEEREKLFKWGEVIAPGEYSLWALKSRDDIVINSIEDVRQYEIGTTNNDVVEQYLKSQNCPQIFSVSGQHAYEQNIKKLLFGRIDVWGVATLPGNYFMQQAGADTLIKEVYRLKEITTDGLYVAFNRDTPDSVVKKFSDAVKRIKENGIYDNILNSYLN